MLKNLFKNLKWAAVITSAIYIAAGILLLIYPEASENVICYVIGIACIVTGIIKITTYFMIDLQESLYRNDFRTGVLLIMLGILAIYKQNIIHDLIPFILGTVIIASGFSKLQDGIDANRLGYRKSWIYLLLAAISIVFGLVIIFAMPTGQINSMLFRVIGIGLLYSGVTDLYTAVYLSGKIGKFIKKTETIINQASGDVINATAQEQAGTASSDDASRQDPPHSADTGSDQ